MWLLLITIVSSYPGVMGIETQKFDTHSQCVAASAFVMQGSTTAKKVLEGTFATKKVTVTATCKEL